MNTPAYIFYPTLIVWSTVYGVTGGAFFKLLAVYENWKATNRYHVLLWIKYPQHSYRQYISNIWTRQIRNKPLELAQYIKMQIERSHPVEPFPFSRLASNTLYMLFITPFMLLAGMVEGPFYVFRKIQAQRNIQHSIFDSNSNTSR